MDGIFDQTEENFTENLPGWKTKRQLGDAYKMNSGTWTQEMDTFENYFRGMNAEELQAFHVKHGSDRNGRIIFANNTNEKDLAKWNSLSADEQAEVDALSGATMSLTDAHGDLHGAPENAFNAAKPCEIKIQ